MPVDSSQEEGESPWALETQDRITGLQLRRENEQLAVTPSTGRTGGAQPRKDRGIRMQFAEHQPGITE